MLTLEEREILAQMIILFEGELWSNLSNKYEEATGEELTEEAFNSMKSKLIEF